MLSIDFFAATVETLVSSVFAEAFFTWRFASRSEFSLAAIEMQPHEIVSLASYVDGCVVSGVLMRTVCACVGVCVRAHVCLCVRASVCQTHVFFSFAASKQHRSSVKFSTVYEVCRIERQPKDVTYREESQCVARCTSSRCIYGP